MNHRRKIALRRVEPRKHDRPTVLFHFLQTELRWTNWTSRVVSYRTASAMVAAGQAEVVTRTHKGQTFEMFRETETYKPSKPSQTTLTRATSEAVARCGESDLSAGEIAHINKFICWPWIPTNPACTTIRPRVGERELNRYNALMQREDGYREPVKHLKPRTQAAYYPDQAAA